MIGRKIIPLSRLRSRYERVNKRGMSFYWEIKYLMTMAFAVGKRSQIYRIKVSS